MKYDVRSVATRLGRLTVRVPSIEPGLALWPGVFYDHRLHLPLAEELGRAGVGTVLIDPPGFAGSDPISSDFSMADCGLAMAEVIESLAVGPLFVGGTSWGGATAAWAAIEAPELVNGAVLMNAPYDKGHRKYIAGPIPVLARWVPPSLFALGGVPASIAPERVRARAASLVRAQYASLSSATAVCRQRAGKRVFWHREPLWRGLPRMQSPALVIAGARDQLCPVRHAERATALIPQGEFWLSPDTGHLTAFEAPSETAERILTFMRGVSG